MPPNFEEVKEAYWFGHVRGSVCLTMCASVMLAYGQEQLEVGSRNLICGITMKYKRTRFFFLFESDLSLQSHAPFSTFFDFLIVNLWNYVNKISQKPFELGSWYLAYRLCQRCRRPDRLLAQFCKYLTELSPFSDFGILCCKATLWTKYQENRLSRDHDMVHDVDQLINFS